MDSLIDSSTAVGPDAQAGASSFTALPACSLIVISRNRPELLEDLVRSVLGGRERPSEIVIVDQSVERHPALAAQAAGSALLRYEWTRSVGASRARNLGIRLARHDVLAFSDDDMLAPPDWFGSLIRALLYQGRQGVVTGRVTSSAENAEGFAPSTKDDPTPRVFEGRLDRDVLYSGNMAMYRATLERVGGFDERLGPGTSFPAAEDNDLGFRLLEAGYRIVHVPQAVLLHRDWRSGRAEFLSLRWRYGLGQGGFLAKHLRWNDRFMLHRLISSTRHYAVRMVRNLPRQRASAAGDATYLLALHLGMVRWLLTRRDIGPRPVGDIEASSPRTH